MRFDVAFTSGLSRGVGVDSCRAEGVKVRRRLWDKSLMELYPLLLPFLLWSLGLLPLFARNVDTYVLSLNHARAQLRKVLALALDTKNNNNLLLSPLRVLT